MIEYFVEVPNTGIQEPVRSLDDAYPMCYDLAQQFGFAEVCWYALNGKRVTGVTTPTETNPLCLT